MSYHEYNKILQSNEARKKIKEGINIATDLVSKTLGAKSQRILIDKEFGEIESCDDGTTVLKAIRLEDPNLDLGVKIVQEASAKTDSDSGDGTTTTAVILRSLVNELLKENSQDALAFDKQSGNNLKIRRELQKGLEKVLNYIDNNKIEITSQLQIAQIGKVSSNSEEVGDMLAEIFDRLGKSGEVIVSEGNQLKTKYEITEGFSFRSGWLAYEFVTDTEREEAILDAVNGPVNVLVTTETLNDISHIEKLGELHKAGINDILIVANDVTGIPLSSLVVNKLRKIFRTVAIKAPNAGNNDALEDIADITGATLLGSSGNPKFSELKPEYLGHANKVIVSKDKTVVVGQGNNERLDVKIKNLEYKAEKTDSDYEKKAILERISKLRVGIGNIIVGGNTPLELKDKKGKITDAVSAVKSALKDGVVSGGGVALLQASKTLEDGVEGERILKIAIQKPFEQIMENSDMSVKEMKEMSLKTGHGVDAETGEEGDMIKMGILDSAGIVKTSLSNAVSDALVVGNLGGAIVLVRKQDDGNKTDN